MENAGFDIRAEHARVLARLSAHEFILENLVAKDMLSHDVSLERTAEIKEEFVAACERAYGRPSGDIEMVQMVMAALREHIARFFDKVAQRMTDERGKRR